MYIYIYISHQTIFKFTILNRGIFSVLRIVQYSIQYLWTILMNNLNTYVCLVDICYASNYVDLRSYTQEGLHTDLPLFAEKVKAFVELWELAVIG